jgi:hypothetical protein
LRADLLVDGFEWVRLAADARITSRSPTPNKGFARTDVVVFSDVCLSRLLVDVTTSLGADLVSDRLDDLPMDS